MSSLDRRRSKKRKEVAGNAVYTVIKVVAVILVIMVIYRCGSIAYEYGERLFGEPAMDEAPGEDVVITVEETDSVRDVADKLEEAGLIRDAGLFVVQEALAGYKTGLQPGTYTLNTSWTVEQMLQVMCVVTEVEEP